MLVNYEFDLQRFAITLPSNPMSGEATVGKDYLLYVAGINGSAESWYVIGGQSSATIDESTDEIDVTTKTSGGFKASLPGLTAWSVDLEAIALMPNSDDGVEILRRAKQQKKQVKAKIVYPDGSYRIGWASSTKYSVEAGSTDKATLKGTLSGYGPLSDYSQIVSIAEPEDLTFFFDSKAAAIAVSKDSTALEAASYTATTKGQVLLKSTYLATLTAGDYLFYATLSTGGYALLAVTVTA